MRLSTETMSLTLLLLVTLQGVLGEDPTPAPTISMYPTTTYWPTASMWPTATAYPTATGFPTPGPDLIETANPTMNPTTAPTETPDNVTDTESPTVAPAVAPTVAPMATPTATPTAVPITTEAPTAAPTMAAQNTTAPTVAPTVTPTVAPTAIPTMPPFNATDAPTGTPTSAPSTSVMPTSRLEPTAVPTVSHPPSEIPSMVPTNTPVEITLAPSSGPSAAPTTSFVPTASPVENATDAPTLSPVEATDAPTAPPTGAPVTPAPTLVGTPVETTLKGITMDLSGAGELLNTEISEWESYSAEWFNGFFLEEQNNNGRRRFLQDAGDVRDMTATFDLTGQDVRMVDGTVTNTLTYDQTLSYIAQGDAAEQAEAIAALPFEDEQQVAVYSLGLKSDFDNFGGLRIPIEAPTIPDQEPVPPPADGGDDGLSTGAIIGIAVAGAVVVAGAGYFAYSSMSGGGDDGGGRYADADSNPPQFNMDEDIDTVDDPNAKSSGGRRDEPALLEGGYGDQSVATVDYDYSKAYGGGEASVVSSAGGTMGDTTRQTSDQAASAAALTALGAESQFRSSEGGTKEDVLEIIAPAGKLGVVIDTPDDGAPVVHAVKDSSVIADQIQVGDKLVAVDEEDVRAMTAIKVSKLISKKSANPERKLTIIRTSLADEP